MASAAFIQPPLRRRLADGAVTLIRPVTVEDRQRLIDGIAAMSSESRYLRFFSGMKRPSEEQVRYLTEVDQINHIAWGAVDPTQPAHPGMGLGRFIRLTDDPKAAEGAVAVVDAYQQLGLGTLLLALMVADADRRGIQRLHFHVLPENHRALRWTRGLGFTSGRDADGVLLTLQTAAALDPANFSTARPRADFTMQAVAFSHVLSRSDEAARSR